VTVSPQGGLWSRNFSSIASYIWHTVVVLISGVYLGALRQILQQNSTASLLQNEELGYHIHAANAELSDTHDTVRFQEKKNYTIISYKTITI
jgi:hypothetical protein